jgi:hypothetical protein
MPALRRHPRGGVQGACCWAPRLVQRRAQQSRSPINKFYRSSYEETPRLAPAAAGFFRRERCCLSGENHGPVQNRPGNSRPHAGRRHFAIARQISSKAAARACVSSGSNTAARRSGGAIVAISISKGSASSPTLTHFNPGPELCLSRVGHMRRKIDNCAHTRLLGRYARYRTDQSLSIVTSLARRSRASVAERRFRAPA